MKKNYLKIIGFIVLVAISIFSGISFKFPEEWGLKFVFNTSLMARTFLFISAGITFLRIPMMYEQFRGAKNE